jgi:hypothetical protein
LFFLSLHFLHLYAVTNTNVAEYRAALSSITCHTKRLFR